MQRLEPVTLEGDLVRLEPLSLDHVDALSVVGLDEQLWLYTTNRLSTRSEMTDYVRTALELCERGSALAFATVLRSEDRAIGSTRFANYDAEHRRVEIGWTWIAPLWQRTGANVEAKLLMLKHAFEVVHCNRVEFKTDATNEKSRRALLGIGAREEGTLRHHMVVWNGRLRDSVCFSVLREEWPAVRTRLLGRMNSRR